MNPENARAVEAALHDRERLAEYARRILRDHHEAEDVAQEVALRAREAPSHTASLGSWLRAVCYRLAVDRVRARERHARIVRGLARPEATCATVATDEQLDRARECARVLERLEALPEPYRSALRLRFLEELDFPEIARRLEAPERTTRTWVARGLGRLREDLSQIGIGWWLAPVLVIALALGALALITDGLTQMPPFICTLSPF